MGKPHIKKEFERLWFNIQEILDLLSFQEVSPINSSLLKTSAYVVFRRHFQIPAIQLLKQK